MSTGSSNARGPSDHSNVGAIVGGTVGSVVALFVLGGATLLVLRRRKARRHARLLNMSGTMAGPLRSFEGESEPVVPHQSPVGYLAEKRRRMMGRQDNLLPPTTPSLAGSGGGPSVEPDISTMSEAEYRPRRDDLLELRAEIRVLRKMMRGVRIEQPQGHGSEAPPEYS